MSNSQEHTPMVRLSRMISKGYILCNQIYTILEKITNANNKEIG